jgi:hypothetical protein
MSDNRKSMAERILDCFPGGSYALLALLQLMEIEESREVETAAVECRIQPRLQVSPDFVETWAPTPEKLLMLVMHELHHVLLGHTRLFPCVTRIDNLVFDAVINALLCRMFPDRAYTSFFTDFYDDSKFPVCLLRPPKGWTLDSYPALPKPLRGQGLGALAGVHRALYSEKGAGYHEIFDALRQSLTDDQALGVVLLGSHEWNGPLAGGLDGRAPLMFDVVRQIVERWPQPPDPIRGRSLADILRKSKVASASPPSNKQLLRALLHKIADKVRGSDGPFCSGARTVTVATPLPTFDRRSVVLNALGVPTVLHSAHFEMPNRAPTGDKVHVYLDVSGSIGEMKSALYGAVLDCRDFVWPRLHLFSTQVADVTVAELRAGKCQSTGGTDIACVARHLRENRIRRAVLVTDGFVGYPTGLDRSTLSGAMLGVALTPGNSTRVDLREVANHWIELN